MVDIRREGRGEAQGADAPDRRGRGLGLGTRRGEGTRTPGECARQAPGCLSRWGGEGTKHRRSGVRAFVEHRGLEPRAAQGTLHTEQPGA